MRTGPPSHELHDHAGANLRITALPKVAHLLCELAARPQIVGLVTDGCFRMPMTQRHVADACGMSIVHANRTIQELRHRGLIAWEGNEIELLQPEQLQKLADFAPDYLT